MASVSGTVYGTGTWKSEMGQGDVMQAHSLSLGINAKEGNRVSLEAPSGK